MLRLVNGVLVAFSVSATCDLALAGGPAAPRPRAVQPTGIRAVYRSGQTFITWKDAAKGEAGANLRYSLYRSDKPITQDNLDYAGRVEAALTEAGIRTKLDDTKERMAHKIRDAELMKVPAIFVVGKKEEEAGTVSVRERGKGDQGAVALDEAVAKLKKEIETKSTGQI